MLFNIFLSILTLNSAHADTKLLIIGGGVRPPEAMNEFVTAAGGSTANILVFSWASATQDGAQNIKTELLVSHPLQVTVMPAFPLKPEEEAALIPTIKKASGIFFSGGDQNLLMKVIKTEKVKDLFKLAYQNGVVFGGSSAGTAVMSERMLTGEGDLTVLDGTKTPLAEGLGLLPTEIIVDQHFIVRQRFNRLAGLILQNKNTFGIGVDQGTALFVINNKTAKVMGPTQVLLFTALSAKKLTVEVFSHRESFDLP